MRKHFRHTLLLKITTLLLYSTILLSAVSATKLNIGPLDLSMHLPQTYFVVYDKTAMHNTSNPTGANFTNYVDMEGNGVSSCVQNFLEHIEFSGVNFKLRYSLEKLLDCVSITVSHQDDLERLNNMTIVKKIWPVSILEQPKVSLNAINDSKGSPSNLPIDELTGVAQVRAGTKYSGKNIKVGIIDTGIDYTHPAFGNCFKTKGCKIQFGYDFVGDAFNGSNTPHGDNDPLDQCNGHGTHVAGILAAEDKANNFTGVAPGVTLGIYRIFGCNGTTTNDLLVKAMERASDDGMDIINFSVGVLGAGGWAESPEAVATENTIAKGIIVVAVTGNNGNDQAIFKAASPGVALNAISVASVDNTKIQLYYLLISSSPEKKIGYWTPNNTRFNISGNSEIVATSNNTKVIDDACNAQPANLTGKIALIRRGGCTFIQKSINAQAAGAIGILFYDNVISTIFPPIINSSVTIPVALTYPMSGEFIFNQIQNKNVTITFPNDTFVFSNPTGGKISSFSSLGPSNEMDIKPEIAAPGGAINSTYPVKLGSYRVTSGTSMAAPYVAGCVAVIFEAKGKMSAVETKKLFMNTAHPVEIPSSSNKNVPHTSIVQQGAGLINLLDALSSTISISPYKLSLNDTENYKALNTLTIKNSGKKNVKFTVSHVGAQAVNGYNFTESFAPQEQPVFQDSFAEVNISESSIELGPGQSKSIKVVIKPPSDLDNGSYFLFSGFILFSDITSNKSYSVPYMGMKGILKTLPILDTASGTPFIQTAHLDVYRARNENVTFTLQSNDTPTLIVLLAEGTRILAVDVVPANTTVQSKVGKPNVSSLVPAEKSKRSPGRLYRRIPGVDKTPNIETEQPEITPSDIQVNRDLVPDSLGKIAIDGVQYYVSRTLCNEPILIPWEGKIDTVDGRRNVELPNGSYRLVVSVLKLFGEEKRKSDWEIW
ncbi:13388_t:CDS:2, partial [Ambispora leptoticha]